jgi:hypothetical protein
MATHFFLRDTQQRRHVTPGKLAFRLALRTDFEKRQNGAEIFAPLPIR